MNEISVVIITKNEAAHITDCIKSAQLITADILVSDNGSTDDTLSLAEKAGAKVIKTEWKGFGTTRNMAAAFAKHNWILALDADERITQELKNSLDQLNFENNNRVYGFKRQNYLNHKKIRFGEWGRDKVFRLYHKEHTHWSEVPVHEQIIGENAEYTFIKGYIEHYPVSTPEKNKEKTVKYAQLNALKFFQQQKKATFAKRFLSPAFNFIKMYILLLGFLDGKEGFRIAKYTTEYTWLKYHFLHELYRDAFKKSY